MIIDECVLEDGITSEILSKLIMRHQSEQERLTMLKNYYLGEHKIKSRHKLSDTTSNNRLVCNHAKYIVDMVKSYLVGNPVSYASSENYNIEPIKNCYLTQDIAHIDCELEKQMSIYGKSYELIFANEDAEPRSVCLSPMNTFVVYGTSVSENPLFGVHYYRLLDISGRVTGTCCIVCDAASVYIFENTADSFNNMELTSVKPHHFGAVPILEYRNNEEKQGDFEQLISLIDAYNVLQSDRVNDKEQFVDSFLFLNNIEIDGEQAQKLREERILMGYEGSDAKYLSKVMSESDIMVLRDNIKQDIHRFSMVPDLSDESFGNNLSGVAIKYKLMGFEQHIRNKERYFSRMLKQRFKLYNHFLELRGSMDYVPVHRVDVVFTRNLPVNELEVSQMINNLSGIATAETLLSQLSFVTDPKEEAELAAREKISK
jgi:SPP1 family phage portal protein